MNVWANISRRCQTWSSANQSMLQCAESLSLWRVNRYSTFSQKSYFGDRFRIRSSIYDRSIFFFRSFLFVGEGEGEKGITSRWRMYRDGSRKHIQRSHVGKVVKALFALPSKLHALRLRNEFLSEVQILRTFFIWGTIAADNSEVSALRSSPRSVLLLLSVSLFPLLPDCISRWSQFMTLNGDDT